MSTPPSTGAPPASAVPWALPPSPPPRRRWVIPVVAVVVVALVAVAVLAAAGVLHFAASNSSPPGNQTFSQAMGSAQSRASSVPGAPWTAFAGAALVSTLEVTEPSTNLSTLESLSNCNLTWIGGQPSELVVPATPPSASIGTAAFWWFAFKNGSSALMVETVSEGSASPLVFLTGGDCAMAGPELSAFPSGLPDSPTILTATDAAGGTAFLTAHANASELWVVDAGFTFFGLSSTPEWLVEYTSCSATASPTQTGAVFNATVNGLTGIVTQNASGTAECALSVSTGPTLAAPTWFLENLLRKAI